MGKCVNHPDRDTSYQCTKHGVYLCEACLQCRDPELYCKFRSACPIWFLSKKGTEGWADENERREEEVQADGT